MYAHTECLELGQQSLKEMWHREEKEKVASFLPTPTTVACASFDFGLAQASLVKSTVYVGDPFRGVFRGVFRGILVNRSFRIGALTRGCLSIGGRGKLEKANNTTLLPLVCSSSSGGTVWTRLETARSAGCVSIWRHFLASLSKQTPTTMPGCTYRRPIA